MNTTVYNSILKRKKEQSKSFAVLVDPDKIRQEQVGHLLDQCNKASVDLILVGGSLVVSEQMESLVTLIKKESSIPVVLFPGSPSQVTPAADALLYLSLISGRNPEIGRAHV